MLFKDLTASLGLFFALSFAYPSTILPKEIPRRQDALEETPMCGQIIDAVNDGYRFFYAADAYECLISVPFHEAAALRFIEYYNTTMQFQSTLKHLKNPPEGYQQPAFDLMQGLEDLKRNVTAGVFKNQYDFEATMQYLIYSVHDAHVSLRAGVLSAFSFASPIPLVAASIDGKETPKIYFADDIIDRQNNLTNGIVIDISAISHINGEPAVEFLTKFAALQSVGMLEPHADWNELMDSPVQDVQGIFSIFAGSSTFYPGDTLNFTFEAQGKPELKTHWLAIYDNAEFTGPLTTGGDFYNFFVLGLLPASYPDVPLPPSFGGLSFNEDGDPITPDLQTIDGMDEYEEPTSWYEKSFTAFPKNADVKLANLSSYGANIITGYFYDDISTGVLSIPHFNHYDDDLGDFGELLTEFMEGAEEKGLNHVILDLQKNFGGSSGSALFLFRELFPGVDPFAGSQRRSHKLANILGSATTHKYREQAAGSEEDQEDSLSLVSDEWTIVTRLNAETRRNFSSWEEYQGPRQQLEDDMSLVEQYDLKNPTFHVAAFDGWLLNRYLDDNDAERHVPWTPENIVILTDGTCSSACALFLELATQAGARTVVVGGAPKPGPMQAAAGTRGARVYSGDELDYDFEWIGEHNETAKAQFPANRQDRGIFIKHAGFNLRDQLRADDISTPLQFRYAAADCRLYFTIDNVYNMTTLWHDVSRAAFQDPSLCVEGSTGYTSRNGTASPKTPPKPSTAPVPAPKIAVTFADDHDTLPSDGLPAGRERIINQVSTEACVPQVGKNPCTNGGACVPINYSCLGQTAWTYICVSLCNPEDICFGTYCTGNIKFNIERDNELVAGVPRFDGLQRNHGYCNPPSEVQAVCSRRNTQTPPPLSGEPQRAPSTPGQVRNQGAVSRSTSPTGLQKKPGAKLGRFRVPLG
ncbi:peptidase s41 family protein [Colletotrichum truncatum]|uniref:Peptidase s41 family protein n=1 Tax=Colletotrichum truncatum TaxID=5467 RepID=A0ACC3YSR3_COLTU|nr:peptidase s41 family protein [Colletotrichum truncatum]KAF6799209.1 peptidase s41 family protein [Colletotrichum truncatum]